MYNLKKTVILVDGIYNMKRGKYKIKEENLVKLKLFLKKIKNERLGSRN